MTKSYYFTKEEVDILELLLKKINITSNKKISDSKLIRYLIHLGINNIDELSTSDLNISMDEYFANSKKKDTLSSIVDEIFKI